MKTWEEKVEILEKLGFADAPDCDLLAVLSPSRAIKTPMSVTVDHASVIVYIYYARGETKHGVLDGFFHAPSLLEYMLLDFGAQWNPKRLLQQINRRLGLELQLVYISGYPMFYAELTDFHWNQPHYLSTELGDMYKLAGVLDYLLPHTQNRLQAKRKKQL